MAPSPGSGTGELWGFHVMPTNVTVDCLLPNGIYIPLNATRDCTLVRIKQDVWKEAKKYPLFKNLLPPSSYVFVTVTHDGEREECYDESRRLCDLRLFLPVLRLEEPAGNRQEKILNFDISIAIGRPCSELDEILEPEVLLFRQLMFGICEQAWSNRISNGYDPYRFAVDIIEDLSENPQLENKHCEDIVVCVWGTAEDSGKNKVTVKISTSSPPKELIKKAWLQRTKKLSSQTTVDVSLNDEAENFILKVAGSQVYLLHEKPLLCYGYIRQCIAEHRIPQLMLMRLADVMAPAAVTSDMLIRPSLLKRQPIVAPVDAKNCISIWEVDDLFKIKVINASYINATDVDEVYVRVGLYHGPEELVVKDTQSKPFTDPRWNEYVEFNDLTVQEVPCATQLCLSICSIKHRKQKEERCALAWANLRLFDFNDYLVSGPMHISMWPFPKDFEGSLNPLGNVGSNPDRESPTLDIEFANFGKPIVYPPSNQIHEYVKFVQSYHNRAQNKLAIPSEDVTKVEVSKFEEIIKQDPLYEMDEKEKELMWRLRLYCKTHPNSLPRLLDAVKWTNREEVAEIYVLLEDWPVVSPEVALELLHVRYPDSAVRRFAVRCLEENLSDEKLHLFLISLIQVLKYEPFINNDLTKFLLKRALLTQRIGHLFFWNLRSEISYNYNASWSRFALILEAYCRGCGSYLKSLVRQVEAVEKLTAISMELKERKEEATKILQERMLLQADCQEALQNLESPLDCAQILGTLVNDGCKIVDSAKKPIWLVWKNPDPLAELYSTTHELIFKCGDDLRQDMLTLQVIKIMDSIWKRHGCDFKLTPYICLSTGKQSGIIQVVQKAKTILQIQRSEGVKSAFTSSSALHKWLKDRNKGEKYDQAIEIFTKSCAGYCVATFVLGIRDRHQSNIMMTEDGHIFHIDFGHFLGHYKKKFGINRERVPFVLTEDFIRVIAKGAENPRKSEEFERFQKMCAEAYLILHQNAHLFLALFAMMLCMGIPELQRIEDVSYLRRTLAAEMTAEAALEYFNEQLNEAYLGGWTTKADWLMHFVRHM